MTMTQPATIDAMLNQTATRRLRFETIVNELLDEGLLTKDQLVISPERTSVYNFERDVREVKERPNDRNDTHWQFDIPRDGFYDTLPEQLFHRAKKRTKDEDEWADIREEEEKQEQESRHFFLPFDSEFNHQRAAIARFETQTLSGNDNALITELLKLVAPEAGSYSLTVQQKLTLFLLIIHAHHTVGNWPETAAYFSRFLQVPVHIAYGLQRPVLRPVRSSHKNEKGHVPRLGAIRAGVNWILPPGQAPADDGGVVQIAIGPLAAHQLADYLPNGIGWRYVSLLAGYLLPVDADYLVVPLPEAEGAIFSLGSNATSGRLGMTTGLTPSSL